jgi:hypothetical protein
VPQAAPPARRVVLHKELKLNLTLDFATLARAAAVLIAALAAAYLYFFSAR